MTMCPVCGLCVPTSQMRKTNAGEICGECIDAGPLWKCNACGNVGELGFEEGFHNFRDMTVCSMCGTPEDHVDVEEVE